MPQITLVRLESNSMYSSSRCACRPSCCTVTKSPYAMTHAISAMGIEEIQISSEANPMLKGDTAANRAPKSGNLMISPEKL